MNLCFQPKMISWKPTKGSLLSSIRHPSFTINTSMIWQKPMSALSAKTSKKQAHSRLEGQPTKSYKLKEYPNCVLILLGIMLKL